ncbi:MAG: ABC transporter permease [Actinobacteria bacterium]|nr:ABC transporter permease [Actinomycetota bacterium]
MKTKNLIAQFIRGVAITAEKNIRIYYAKAPVLIFGIIFPIFLFLSFYLGRKIDLYVFFPGFLAMSLFFGSSSVGPMITPWEKNAGTYERLLSFPITVNIIILGDVIAGMLYGIIINIIILTGGLIFLAYNVNAWGIILGTILASFCFSSLGVLLASPPVKSPSTIMMLSSVIRFPLLFISGIFIPIGDLTLAGKILCYISPVTYIVDIFNFSLKGTNNIAIGIDFIALILFSCLFFFLSSIFQKRNLLKGL